MAEPQKSSQPQPDPNEKLVKVFESEEETETLVVKGLLDSGGIDADMTALSLTQSTFPSLGGTIILVREEDAARARQLIAEYQQDAPSSEDEEADEEEPIEGPPAKP